MRRLAGWLLIIGVLFRGPLEYLPFLASLSVSAGSFAASSGKVHPICECPACSVQKPCCCKTAPSRTVSVRWKSRCQMPSPLRPVALASQRHSGGSSYVYADGHAKWQRFENTRKPFEGHLLYGEHQAF